MHYCHVLPTVSIYHTMEFPFLLTYFMPLFFFPLLQYSCFYSHLHPHKLCPVKTRTRYINTCSSKGQNLGLGLSVPSPGLQTHFPCPCIPCPCSTAQQHTGPFPHMKPTPPTMWVSSPSTRLSAQTPLPISMPVHKRSV